MAAFVLIQGRIFADRLPGSGPEVLRLVVPKIEVAAGLVELVKNIAQNAPVGAGLRKTVASGVVGDNRAVFGRTEVVHPRCGCIGSLDDIFAVFLIKISVSHIM